MASRKWRLLIQVITVMTLMTKVFYVASLYVPSIGHPMRVLAGREVDRRQDSDYDDDDMDSNASAPYQQEDTNGAQADGYEENDQG